MTTTQMRNRYWRLKRDGICTLCGSKPSFNGRVLCYDCTKRTNLAHRIRIQGLKDKGLCINCGRVSRPDRYRCQACEDRKTRLNKTNHRAAWELDRHLTKVQREMDPDDLIAHIEEMTRMGLL